MPTWQAFFCFLGRVLGNFGGGVVQPCQQTIGGCREGGYNERTKTILEVFIHMVCTFLNNISIVFCHRGGWSLKID